MAKTEPKSGNYRFIKFGQLTGGGPKEVAKIIFRILFLTGRRVKIKKPKEHYPTDHIGKNDLYFILVSLVGRAHPKIC